MNIEENGVSRPITKDDLSKVIAAFDGQTSSGSRFSDPAKVLREAEAFCEDADAVDEEDRIHEEHMCLALWDELRNLRREVSRLSKEQNAQYIENVWLKDANADHLLKIEDLKEALSPFALFASALDGFDPMKSVRTIGVKGIRVSAFIHARELLGLPNA